MLNKRTNFFDGNVIMNDALLNTNFMYVKGDGMISGKLEMVDGIINFVPILNNFAAKIEVGYMDEFGMGQFDVDADTKLYEMIDAKCIKD